MNTVLESHKSAYEDVMLKLRHLQSVLDKNKYNSEVRYYIRLAMDSLFETAYEISKLIRLAELNKK